MSTSYIQEDSLMIVTLKSALVAAVAMLVLLSSGWPGVPVHAQTTVHTQDEHRTGMLAVVWGDPLPGTGGTPIARYTLVDTHGRATELVIDGATLAAHDHALALHGQQVTVTGTRLDNGTFRVAALARAPQSARVETPADALTATPAGVSGSQRWVTVLCRFADQPTFTPYPPAYYHTLMGSSYPGMDHYWREASYNTISIDGGTVVGWYTLPRTRAQYRTPEGDDNTTLLTTDCAAAADRDVAFPQFVGINFVFNGYFTKALGYGAPTTPLTIDGQTRTYRTTWIGHQGVLPQSILAHEMGHAFGLPHSSGPYDETYDSPWDVMSDGSTCTPYDEQYGCIAAHTIAYHKHLLGWIPAASQVSITAPGTQQITLGQLATPASGTDDLFAQISINGSATQFYTVEARRAAGYDRYTPGDAVVIHRVNTVGDARPARLVDGDNNGSIYDDGPSWVPGETFRDTTNGINITVDRATATGFAVTITSTSTAPNCPDIAYEPDNDPSTITRSFAVGTTETHALCDAYDIDWVVVDATAGTTYRLETRNLTPGTDTLLRVFGPGLADRIDNNGNGGLASLITFTAPTTAQYNVGVEQVDGRGSPTLRYDLRITATPTLPPLQPRVWIPLVQR